MIADIQQITRLQALDLRIAELQREIATLPKHIAHIEKTLDSHLRRVEADRAALAANQKERKSLEDDSKVQDQKISKLKNQMLEAKNNEQYKAFQHEIEYSEKEIRRCEDRILQLMAESEPLEVNLKKAEAALKEEKKQVDGERAKVLERTASDQKQLTELESERKGIVAHVSPDLIKNYERIRKKWRGIVIAEASGGRCGACMITLRAQFAQDLRRGDQLMFCESCGRIIYYNPPVTFEADLAIQGR